MITRASSLNGLSSFYLIFACVPPVLLGIFNAVIMVMAWTMNLIKHVTKEEEEG